jgi:hypothetical protein
MIYDFLGCKANTPDASGSFPIHLACSRIEDNADDAEEDLNRWFILAIFIIAVAIFVVSFIVPSLLLVLICLKQTGMRQATSQYGKDADFNKGR